MARTTRSSVKREFPPESSWRMVEGGENDSFDTSILHDDDDFIGSSGSQPVGSQSFSIGGSQPWSIGGSQDDSIENFLSKAEDDEQVLLRSPFRPSVPKAVRESSRENLRQRSPEPEPEFYMPKVDVASPRRASTRSSTTIRASVPPPSPPRVRRRQAAAPASPAKGRRVREDEKTSRGERAALGEGSRASTSLFTALFNAVSWALEVVGLALRYAKKPLAILVSLYITFGGVIVLQNMASKSIYMSLSPICRIPGVSWMDLPFCPELKPAEGGRKGDGQPIRFDGLMHAQDKFQRVAEMAADGLSLPMEMKRSESSIRDLRTVVRYSSLMSKEELILEFDGFIDTAQTVTSVLQRFNTRVSSTVDWVISITRWTSRNLEPFDKSSNRDDQSGVAGLIGAWTDWLLSPFQPTLLSERYLLDRYIEHTELVSDKVARLILEAREVLHSLARAEEHLDAIYNFVTRTHKTVQGRKDDILWTLWTLVGANNRRLSNYNSQLALLKQVDGQRSGAVRLVNELIVELEKIQASLGDLKGRVSEPGLLRDQAEIPLSVHIETINRGVERLEEARGRIRSIEDERIKEVLARGKGEEKLIDA
ncbi:uncharacterized protein B0H64DRAFT_382492 [Chaetomium fimeti]|uniref:Uncharacterized protein n=1 Tax=Chaetomium fimeti TaxID=1854472 RepID=A0AAE0LXD0_9PEZI|nr:hypothetical protein B0H64DRAFT_382492 [Chaetomium fimeti]